MGVLVYRSYAIAMAIAASGNAVSFNAGYMPESWGKAGLMHFFA